MTDTDSTVLVLRTCKPDRTSHSGFVWPEVGGTATAPDWDPDPDRACGGGLHGLLWGCGDAHLLSHAADALWQVVAVKPVDIANPDAPGKVRFRSGVVVFEGDRDGATTYLLDNGAAGRPVVYGTATAGHYGTATAGNGGTATAGCYGTATAGHYGTATAGYYGTATAGDYGTATARYCGTATAGHYGTATAGDYGTATAGDYGTATAGNGGTIVVRWWDAEVDRYRLTIGYPGEDGIEPNVAYRCDGKGNLVRAEAVTK